MFSLKVLVPLKSIYTPLISRYTHTRTHACARTRYLLLLTFYADGSSVGYFLYGTVAVRCGTFSCVALFVVILF